MNSADWCKRAINKGQMDNHSLLLQLCYWCCDLQGNILGPSKTEREKLWTSNLDFLCESRGTRRLLFVVRFDWLSATCINMLHLLSAALLSCHVRIVTPKSWACQSEIWHKIHGTLVLVAYGLWHFKMYMLRWTPAWVKKRREKLHLAYVSQT